MIAEHHTLDQESAAEAIYAEVLARPPVTPRPASTYRLQFNAGFRFNDALALVDYLHRLGISHVYASPIYRAGPGSPHGYDVADPGELNPELGTPQEFEALCGALQARGMGLIVDFVSNHFGIGSANPYWMDVLEHGRASRYADFFDIDWSPINEELKNRILIPILGDQFGRVLERAELKLELLDGTFIVRYYENIFPIHPPQYRQILEHLLEHLPENDPRVDEIQAIMQAVQADDLHDGVRRRLHDLSQDLAREMHATLDLFNGDPDDPASFDPMDALLSAQPYRLAHWRVAGEEINYRRFFDINTLAAIRVEDPEVFSHVHRLVLRWSEEARISGLRIDHPDGLYDPAAYFGRLQEEHVLRACHQVWDGLGPDRVAWDALEAQLRKRYRTAVADGTAGPLLRPLYVVAEKILARAERMPASWAIDGTTGYEFLNALNGIFVDRSRAEAIDEVYHRFVGRKHPYLEMVYRKKKLVMADAMSSEINMLARRLNRISEMNRSTRDFTLNSLKRALVEYIACLSIYRTYVHGRSTGVDARDRHYVNAAIARARLMTPTLDPSIYDFLRDLLLLRDHEARPPRERSEILTFVMKVQQLTGAITAKGIEDTCFYLYNRLISLNEVGGEPEHFGNSVEDFHQRNKERAASWQGALSATSTHDTKRSEDVRARINVLSEIPDEWKYHVWLWNRIHMPNKRELNGHLAPDRNEEIHLYQLLLGTWPRTLVVDDAYRERIRSTMRKVGREGKIHTSWLNPNDEYEAAVASFVDAVLSGPEAFFADMIGFMRQVALAGMHNSLSQVLLKIASPGVPDIYQGCELWDDSLVDPDNRRPVDFSLRIRLLQEVDEGCITANDLYRAMTDPLDEGRVKLFVHALGLRFRRDHPALFARGRYLPLEPLGNRRNHLCAFARKYEQRTIVAVAPRLVYRLLGPDGLLSPEVWKDTWIPVPGPSAQKFLNVFTGQTVTTEDYDDHPSLPVPQILGELPVALLTRVG